jgi:hypothetical protein
MSYAMQHIGADGVPTGIPEKEDEGIWLEERPFLHRPLGLQGTMYDVFQSSRMAYMKKQY